MSNIKKEVAKKMRMKEIKSTLKMFGSSSHPSKKAAPGISHKELTPKEKYYRKDHEKRETKRINNFENSAYGRHLTQRERNRGENQ